MTKNNPPLLSLFQLSNCRKKAKRKEYRFVEESDFEKTRKMKNDDDGDEDDDVDYTTAENDWPYRRMFWTPPSLDQKECQVGWRKKTK